MSPKRLHQEAMSLCFQAHISKVQETKMILYREALELELQCLEKLKAHTPTPQPTLAIIRQSTAAVAHSAGDLELCRVLVDEGLADPHSDDHVRMRLRELMEEN